MRSNFHSRDLSDRNLGDAVINHILTASANFPLSGPLPANLFKAINLEEEIIHLWHYVYALRLRLQDVD